MDGATKLCDNPRISNTKVSYMKRQERHLKLVCKAPTDQVAQSNVCSESVLSTSFKSLGMVFITLMAITRWQRTRWMV